MTRSSLREPPLGRGPARHEAWFVRAWRGPPAGVPAFVYLLAWAVVLAAVWIAIGELLTHVAARDTLGRADLSTERWLARHRDGELNAVTAVLSALANTRVVVAIGVALAAAAAWTWRRWREAALLLAALLGEVAIFVTVTLVVHRPRPPVPRLDGAPPTSSFPSGHTGAAVVLYGAMAIVASERFRGELAHMLAAAFAFAMPILVAFARLYRGMHYPTDVVGGAVLGSAWLAVSLHAVRMGVLHRRLATDDGAG